MKKTKKWWMPALLVCVLMALLVGMAGATPDARPLAAPAIDHGISAYHCIPLRQNVDWEYDPNDLHCKSGTCYFYCPLDPPLDGDVQVRVVRMFAYDNGDGAVCMTLRQHKPNKGSFALRVGEVCTSDSSDDPQIVTSDPADFVLSSKHDVYAYVEITDPSTRLYGFNLNYEPQ